MRFDVVVVAYQSATDLPGCLAELPNDANVMVVDNASTDGSADCAERLGAGVLRNERNLGFAAAANQGAATGKSELILFLNPDAVLSPFAATALVEELEANPDVAIVGPRLQHPDGETQRPSWPYPSARRSWLEALGISRLTGSLGPEDGFVIGACLLVRRAVFEALGGFDERFWLYAEEADLCWRARAAGWKVRLVDRATALHIGGVSGEGVPDLAFEHFQRGTEHFIAKHGGRAALVSHRLAVLVGSVLRLPLLAIVHDQSGRYQTRRSMAARSAKVLFNHPFQVHTDRANGSDSVVTQLVVCSLEAWDDTWRRNQFLVRELLAMQPQLRVLFVEPPQDIVHGLRSGRGLVRARPRRSLRPDGRLWLVQPTKVLPGAFGRWSERLQAGQVRAAAESLGFDRPTLWVNDSSYARLPRRTGWPTLYDITDDWLRAKATPRERRRRIENETRLLADAGAVVVCSTDLATSRGVSRRVSLVPNAVDLDHFRTPQGRPADLPRPPTAVYVGTLHDERLDVELVLRLATSCPDLKVVLVGPDALSPTARSALGCQENVYLLGPRAYAVVPAYLQHADVVIVPHVVSPFTDSLDPIKAYECLAVGRPTVSTPVAGFRSLAKTIHVVPREEFCAQVSQVLLAKDPPNRSIDGIPTWADRAAVFAENLAAARHPRLRVVYLDHCALLSGGELALARLLDAFKEIDAHVILAEHGPIENHLRQAGATIEILSMSDVSRQLHRGRVRLGHLPLSVIWDTVRYVVHLSRRLRQLQPDLVHANSLKSGLYGSLAARLAGVPAIWHVRDRVASDYLPRTAVWMIRKAVSVLPKAVIANSKTTAATLELREERGAVVPSPVVYDAVSAVRVGVVPDLDGTLRIGMLGRIAPWKGQDIFLQAFALAFPTGLVEGVIVGAPLFGEYEFEEQLHALSEELGLRGRVTFTGFTNEVGAVLASLDVLVHASTIPEPFGQVVVEGMAAGLPVVACDAGGPGEIITDGVDGILFPVGDVEGLANALIRLADDPKLRAQLGKAAALSAMDFAPEIVASQVLEIYRQATPNHPAWL